MSGSDGGDSVIPISAPGPGSGVLRPGGPGFGPGGGGFGPGGFGQSPGLGGGTSQIDAPEKLSSAGSGASQLAGRAKALGRQPEAETDTASRSLDGGNWGGQLGGALKFLSGRWSSQAGSLSRNCQAMGQRCTATSRAYKNADTDSASGINSAGTGGNAAAVRKDFG
jgi:hypothetical protein